MSKKAKKSKKKKKQKHGIAFTLIELLAVIIILGIIMLIAIPSVTGYINNSRKETYVDTAKELLRGAVNLVNGGELEVFDTDTTYYISTECIKTETTATSPYGKFNPAYVVVTYDGDNYDYYWLSTDEKGMGVDLPTKGELLTSKSIKSDVDVIYANYAIGNRTKTRETNAECSGFQEARVAQQYASGTGEPLSAMEQLMAKNRDNLKELEDGVYLFTGPQPGNYVSYNNELWRILTIYESGGFKIIRATALTQMQPWNTESGTYANIWGASTLRQYLNGTYFSTLTQEAQNMVKHPFPWYVGKSTQFKTPEEAISDAKTATTYSGIGLVSTYEYLNAFTGECYNRAANNKWGCESNNWIYSTLFRNYGYRAWTITADASHPQQALLIYSSGGSIDVHGIVDNSDITPVVRVKDDVVITGGEGTTTSPYTLGMEK